MHVLSTPPVFFYEREPAEALRLCGAINDAFAEVVAANSRRFAALAALPLQTPEVAAHELERAVRDLGLRGAEICSNVNGADLDDKSLAPSTPRPRSWTSRCSPIPRVCRSLASVCGPTT